MKPHFIKHILLSVLTLLLTTTGWTQLKQTESNLEVPFENIDVEFSTWTYDAQSCGKFVYTPTGTSICIPSDGLSYPDGKPVQGEVTVKYREFHSPVSVLISGINMRYDENGKAQHLETGGMYELRAFQNDQPLSLAQGMEANVKMRSFSTRSDYDFFQYQDGSNQWQKLNSPGNRIEKELAKTENSEPFWGIAAEDSEEWGSGNDDFDPEWNDGWEEESDTSWHQINEFANDIFYSGGITELGIYNYDAILKQIPIVKIKSQFFVPNISDREHIRVYVVYKDINSVFYFNPEQWKDEFYLYTNSPAKIIAVLPGNQVALFPVEDMAKLDLSKLAGKNYVWQMETPQAPLTSQFELQSFLQIN